MTTDDVERVLARVFSKASHVSFRGDDLRAELALEGLSYREAREIPGRIQRGEFPEYGFAKRGKQRTVYFEKGHADKLNRGYRQQEYLGANLRRGRWVSVGRVYHHPDIPDSFALRRLVDEAREAALDQYPRKFLRLLKPKLDVETF